MLLENLEKYFIFIFSITVHEMSHAAAGFLFGDRREELKKRISLNPFVHMDFWGTFLIPFFLIMSGTSGILGWAKPVVIDSGLIRSKMKIFIISISGPVSNLILAVLSALILKISFMFFGGAFSVLLLFSIMLNLILFIFNILPFAPLDGSAAVSVFLSKKNEELYKKISFVFLLLFVAATALNVFHDAYTAMFRFLLRVL